MTLDETLTFLRSPVTEMFMAQTQVYTNTLAAYFEDSSDARKAVDALQQAGFTSAHLGIAHRGAYTGSSSTVGNTTVFETNDENSPSTWDKIKSWFSGEEAEPYADERLDRNSAQQELIPPSERYDEGYDDTSDLHGSFTAMNIPQELRSRRKTGRQRPKPSSASTTRTSARMRAATTTRRKQVRISTTAAIEMTGGLRLRAPNPLLVLIGPAN